MGILSDIFNRVKTELGSYNGDKSFLLAASAAAALVTAADGTIDDSEIDTAIKGLTENTILKGSFKPSEIEEALTTALNNSKSRAGKAILTREIEALMARPIEQRQDVFLIAADVADNDGIGAEEKEVLGKIAKSLSLGDVDKLLAL